VAALEEENRPWCVLWNAHHHIWRHLWYACYRNLILHFFMQILGLSIFDTTYKLDIKLAN
jgi:hypothetical protein